MVGKLIEGAIPTKADDIQMVNKILAQMGSLAMINVHGDVVYVGREEE